MVLALIILKTFPELRIISSPTQVLTLPNEIAATSWHFAVFYRISFAARRGKQTCFWPALFYKWVKNNNVIKWSLTPQSLIFIIHCRCSPINFLSKISIIFPHNSSSLCRLMLLIVQFTTNQITLTPQLSNFITCFITPTSKIDPSRKPSLTQRILKMCMWKKVCTTVNSNHPRKIPFVFI